MGGEGSGGEVVGGVVSGFPVVGEEFLEPFGGVGADALEDVAEVGEGIDLESLTRDDEAGEDGGGSPAVIAAEESRLGGILPSDGNSAQAALGAVVVDLEVCVFAVSDQGVPVRQGVGERLPLWTFRQHLGLLPFEIGVDIIEDGHTFGLPQREAAY